MDLIQIWGTEYLQFNLIFTNNINKALWRYSGLMVLSYFLKIESDRLKAELEYFVFHG